MALRRLVFLAPDTPRLLNSAPENAQLVAKEKKLNVTVGIALEPECNETQDETQALVDASKAHGRPGW